MRQDMPSAEITENGPTGSGRCDADPVGPYTEILGDRMSEGIIPTPSGDSRVHLWILFVEIAVLKFMGLSFAVKLSSKRGHGNKADEFQKR